MPRKVIVWQLSSELKGKIVNQLKLSTIFTNPRGINTSDAFIYYIQIRDISHGHEYRYVGQARNMKRIKEYDRNMLRIQEGLPKRSRKDNKDREYRTVHFVLYTALREGWEINAYPVASCAGMDKKKRNVTECAFIKELHCNLTKEGTNNSRWCIEHLTDTSIVGLGVDPIHI